MRFMFWKQKSIRSNGWLWVMLFPVWLHAQTTYYVSPSGNNSNDGLSPSTAWRTLTYALSGLSPVIAGDTVLVQAGLYTGENILVEKSGSPEQPIVVQGYGQIPGQDPGFEFDYGDSFDASRLPLFDGGNRSSGIAIDLNGHRYLEFRNLQITGYENGIIESDQLFGGHVVLERIYLTNLGDTLADYSGKAIELKSSDNIIRQCVVVNASAQGIYVEGDRNLIEDCKVYCDDNTSEQAAMDYYIVVYYGSYNTIQNCYVERIGDLPHYGHGIGVKGDAQYNNFKNCTAINFRNEAFYVRHRGAQYNNFVYCTTRGITQESTGFVVRDGASYNTFDACVAHDCKRAVQFCDSSEDEGAQFCGRYNRFTNCIFTDNYIAIDFNDYEEDTDVDNNAFYNCVFDGGNTLINVERNNYDNLMVNSIVTGFSRLETDSNGYTLDFDFAYSDFYNNGFAMPAGTGNIDSDPQFVDSAQNDYHLLAGSPCIDTGTPDDAPPTDFDGHDRPQGNGVDMGAFEYSGQTGVVKSVKQDILVYPNPCNDVLFIVQTRYPFEQIRIFNTAGVAMTGFVRIRKVEGNLQVLDVSNLASGVYLLEIEGSRKLFVKR